MLDLRVLRNARRARRVKFSRTSAKRRMLAGLLGLSRLSDAFHVLKDPKRCPVTWDSSANVQPVRFCFIVATNS